MNSKKTIKSKPRQNKKDLKYREKPTSTDWSCQICASINPALNVYCANCLQNLYYYNYISRHMFVSKDELFDQQSPIKRKNSTHSWATDDTCCDDDLNTSDDQSLGQKVSRQPNLSWVDSLLEG